MLGGATTCHRCRACGGEELRFLRRLPSLLDGSPRDFYACPRCGTIVDVSEAIEDYAQDYAQADFDAGIRYYLEYGADIGFIAWLMQVLRAVVPPRNGTPTRFLDVGAGMGFCTDLAGWLGWEAVGVEPSRRGQLGAELLGVSILPQYLEETDLAAASFDVVFSSEVIEHVADPEAFLSTLTRYLAPDGILLLTTPNAGIVQEPQEPEPEILQVFSPRYHLTLFSEAGIRQLLARHGMHDVHIGVHGGVSGKKQLIVIAAKQKGILPADLDPRRAAARHNTCMTGYLEHLLRERRARGQRDAVYWGAAYRLVEHHVNGGDYAAAAPLIREIDDDLSARELDEAALLEWRPGSLNDYAARVPCFLGRYTYYRGIFALNGEADPAKAERCFRLAAHLCDIEDRLPAFYYLGTISQLAKLHEGIAMIRQDKREGLKVFETMLAEPQELPDDLLCRVKDEKAAAEARLASGEATAPQEPPRPSPPAPTPLAEAATIALRELSTVPRQLAEFNAQMERLAEGVTGGTEQVLQGIRECLDRLERLGARGKSVLVHVERLLAVTADTLQTLQAGFRGIHRTLAALGWCICLPVTIPRRLYWRLRTCGSSLYINDLQRQPAPQAESRYPLGEILPGTVIQQEIVCPDDHLSHVALLIGTLRRANTSSLTLSLLDGQGELLREVTRPATMFGDNEFAVFHFPPLEDSRGKTYRLRITSPDARPGNAVTVWARKTRRSTGLTYNGKTVVDAELMTRLGCGRKRTSGGAGEAPRRDLLIITPDRLGAMRIGLAMRHWEIADALTRAGLSVTLASTRPVPHDLPTPAFRVVDLSLPDEKMTEVAREHAAVMVQGTVLSDFPALREIERPLIADMVTPMHIESIETSQEQYVNSLRAIHHCLETAEFFVCGNERQRLYWLGMLTAIGRLAKEDRDQDREFRHLIDVVHFGIPDEEPKKVRPVLKGVHPGIHRDDFLLIWFGGIWNWLNPLPLIRAVHGAHGQDPRIKLFFSMYRKHHEQPHEMAVRARELSKELGALDRSVFFNELPIPFDQRADYLLESDLGVIVQASNFETQLSARTRALDYLWANLPIFINKGDEIGELVAQHGIGVVAESADPAELQRVLLEYVRDPSRRQRAVAAVREVKKDFYWSTAVRPIVGWLARLKNLQT